MSFYRRRQNIDSTLNTLSSSFMGEAFEASPIQRNVVLTAGLDYVSDISLEIAAAYSLEIPATSSLELLYFITPTTGVYDVEQLVTLTSAYTLVSQTAAQKLFNTSPTGAITLPIGTYFFDCLFSLSALNTGTSSIFGFALGGGATFTQLWQSLATATALATPVAAVSTVNTAANVALTAASVTGVGWAKITGKLRVSAAGTVIPQVSLNTAAAAIVGVDSYFRIWPTGSATVTNIGIWS